MPGDDEEKEDEKSEEQEEEASSESEEELTVDQLKEKLAKAEKRAANKADEATRLHLKVEEFEKAETARKQAELTEAQKAEARAKAAEDKQTALEAENKSLKMQGSFESKVRAMKLEFANENAAKVAFKLLDAETVGEDLSGMEDAIKALIKEHPYVFGKPDASSSHNDGSKKGKVNAAATTNEAIANKKRSVTPI
jgi:hypothetical protein